jgi:hypothetical protein
MRLGDLDVLKEMLIKERDAIPLTKTERYGFGVGLPSSHGMSMRGGINKAFRCMEKVPTIDAVPVVRCKDCKHRGDHEVCPLHDIRLCFDGDGHMDEVEDDKTEDEFFCSYGERKEAEDDV